MEKSVTSPTYNVPVVRRLIERQKLLLLGKKNRIIKYASDLMVSNTKELALEQAIQKHLTGSVSNDISEPFPQYGTSYFRLGLPIDFNAEFALDTKLFWEFLETTQEKQLSKLKERNPTDWQRKILERFDRIIKKMDFFIF